MFVLDEADEMLSRGFKDQIYDIFQLMPPNLQVPPLPRPLLPPPPHNRSACRILLMSPACLCIQSVDSIQGLIWVMCGCRLASSLPHSPQMRWRSPASS